MKKAETFLPWEIEKRSFEIIESELKTDIDEKIKPIVKRVIHTTADFSYEESMVFSDSALESAMNAIKAGVTVVTDTNMVKAGINKKTLESFGGQVQCFMADKDVAKEAVDRTTTRAAISMEKASRLYSNAIYAIGNAPTALITLHNLIESGLLKPALIIGVPVGFVNVVESKELIMELNVPYIIAKGRKGGSNVAAAIVNAIMYMAKE